MDYELKAKDIDYIWQVVHHAASSAGGYHNLFATPLEFDENDNRIHFKWPVWMRAIKAYIVTAYGNECLDKLLLSILAEIYNPEKYQQYLDRQQTIELMDENKAVYMWQ